jgi:hypothetical protein
LAIYEDSRNARIVIMAHADLLRGLRPENHLKKADFF